MSNLWYKSIRVISKRFCDGLKLSGFVNNRIIIGRFTTSTTSAIVLYSHNNKTDYHCTKSRANTSSVCNYNYCTFNDNSIDIFQQICSQVWTYDFIWQEGCFYWNICSRVRRIVESRAESLGVHIMSAVSASTDFVVVGSLVNGGRTKENKAEDLGIPLIPEDEWNDIVNSIKGAKTTSTTSTTASAPTKRQAKNALSDDDDDDDDNSHHFKSAPSPPTTTTTTPPPTATTTTTTTTASSSTTTTAPQPMKILKDGEFFDFNSGSNSYRIKHTGDHYYCTCPAWRNQNNAVDNRTCKHLRQYLGDAFEDYRVGSGNSSSVPAFRSASKPNILLANKWERNNDPTNWWISEKLDGVRAYWDGSHFLSRLGNSFPAPDWFIKDLPTDITLDGELFCGRGLFNQTVSIVKTSGSSRWNEVKYQIFDIPSKEQDGFEDRIKAMEQIVTKIKAGGANSHIVLVEQAKCTGITHVDTELKRVLGLGGEGLMLRQPNSKYFGGRSSTLLKVKTFYDAEAIVYGHQKGKGRNSDRVGALDVMMESGKKFRIGTGLSDHDRDNPPPINSIVSYRFQELTPDGIPRFPSYVGVRIDMDAPKDAVIRTVAKGEDDDEN